MGTGYRYTIKTLWGLAKSKELGLTEEELHLLVARETGKDSIRELNRSELSMSAISCRNRRTISNGRKGGCRNAGGTRRPDGSAER